MKNGTKRNIDIIKILSKIKFHIFSRSDKSPKRKNDYDSYQKKLRAKKETLDLFLNEFRKRTVIFEKNLNNEIRAIIAKIVTKLKIYKLFPFITKYLSKISFIYLVYKAYKIIGEAKEALRNGKKFHEYFIKKIEKLIPEESKRSFAVQTRIKYGVEIEFTNVSLESMFNSSEIIFYVKRIMNGNKILAKLFRPISLIDEKLAVYLILKIIM